MLRAGCANGFHILDMQSWNRYAHSSTPKPFLIYPRGKYDRPRSRLKLLVMSATPSPIAPQVLEYCRHNESRILDFLKRLVETESPSDNKSAVDAVGAILAQEFEDLGGEIKIHPQKDYGDHLQADFHGAHGQKPIMLLGHFDTVWSMGTLKTMPYRVDSDEEVGSESSRAITESIARECEAVLVLEPSQGPQGFLKTSRKGVGDCTVRVVGRASHSGVDFDKGRSAIVELAHQILAIEKFVDLPRGITVNPGVIQGGTRSNVVAAEASVEVDLRVVRMGDAAELTGKFRELKAVNPECSITVTGGINRPPMERTEGTVKLFQLAREIGKTLGLDLGESATGGGSDGNFTSALGIPTQDGLGAVGKGAHSANESIVLRDMHHRCGILAGLLLEL